MAAYQLLIIDELGFVSLSKTGAELLFELETSIYPGFSGRGRDNAFASGVMCAGGFEFGCGG